ncbi:hypothetical protein [Alistipes communis]|jgi:hypothetical protein
MSKIFIPDKDRRLFTLEDAIAAANQYMNQDKQIYHNGINETD